MSFVKKIFEQDSEISRISLLYNVNWFISLRWLAAISIILITFFATKIFSLGLQQNKIYLIGVLIFAYNILIYLWFKASQIKYNGAKCLQFARISAHIQIIFDMIALGFLTHFSGGIESPFLFVFIFHPIFASIIISSIEAYIYTVFSILFVGAISIFEHIGLLSHFHIDGFLPFENINSFTFSIGSLFAFSVIQITSVIITSLLMRDLRKKQNELERIKVELEKKNEKLKKKDEMRLLFLASATHDLKSPLNTITSYIQSMVDGYMGEVGEDQKKVLQRILVRINGLRQLISDVLKLGEIEMEEDAGKRVKKFDIITLLAESVEEFKSVAMEKNIKIIFEPHLKEAIVVADPIKIDEVIHNYISNAIKYNRENGTVKITTEKLNGNIKILVSDTGYGIKDEEIPRLFSDFFRSSDIKKMKLEGTGLGLGIVKRIIEKYGGSVGVSSKYGEGSTFYFVLPLSTSEEMTAGTT